MLKLLIIGFSSVAAISAANISSVCAQTNDQPLSAQSDSRTAPATQAEPAAQPASAAQQPAPATQAQRTGPIDNQIADKVDARIAQLKADLRLTSDQETNWPGLQTALHDDGIAQYKALIAGRSVRQDRDERPNDIALMRSEADRLNGRATELRKLADAAEPIYGGLDDRQKHKLVQFIKTDFKTERR